MSLYIRVCSQGNSGTILQDLNTACITLDGKQPSQYLSTLYVTVYCIFNWTDLKFLFLAVESMC